MDRFYQPHYVETRCDRAAAVNSGHAINLPVPLATPPSLLERFLPSFVPVWNAVIDVRVGTMNAQSQSPPVEVAAPDTVGLLAQPMFRNYWLARLLGQAGQGALLYGLLVLIVDRTDKSIYGSLFVVCSIVPSLLFGLFGGWLADRLPQRAFLIGLDVARAAIVALMLRTSADLTTIFAVTLGVWTVHQFYSPTENAIVARIVPASRLPDANSRANLALILAQVLGMVMLAPLLLKLPDERVLFGVVSALYLSAAWFHLRMGRLPGHEPGDKRRPPLAFRRGWQVARADRPIFAALLDAILIGVGMSALIVIMPHYLVRVLDTGADNTVFIFAPAVIGLTLGLQLAPWLGRLIGHGRIATLGLMGFALAIAALGLVDQLTVVLTDTFTGLGRLEESLGISTRTATTMLISVPAGFCSSLTTVGSRTVMLERAPEDVRGQLFATESTLGKIIALIPTLGAGLAVDLIDVRPVALIIAGLLVAGAIAGRRMRGNTDAFAAEAAPAAKPATPA